MTDIQIAGLIMLLVGITSLLFCRRIANIIRSFYRPFGIDISEWIGIAGLVVAAIIFIYSGIAWMTGKQ